MKKRILSMLMAVALVLSMSTSALAGPSHPPTVSALADPNHPPTVYSIPIITLPIEIEPDPCPVIVQPPGNPGDCQGEDEDN